MSWVVRGMILEEALQKVGSMANLQSALDAKRIRRGRINNCDFYFFPRVEVSREEDPAHMYIKNIQTASASRHLEEKWCVDRSR